MNPHRKPFKGPRYPQQRYKRYSATPEQYKILAENKRKIMELLSIAKDLTTRTKISLEGDYEPLFLEDNKGKTISFLCVDGMEKKGILVDISTYGIIIETEDGKSFVFKQSIIYYKILED